jgi:serine/threonine-protein kinase
MNLPQPACDPRRIEQCLGDSLSDNERAEFEAHLESCADCRRALESSAADAGDWQAAREFLSSADSLPLPFAGEGRGGGDERNGTATPSPQPSPVEGEEVLPTGDVEAASIDDVLAVLGPTDDPRMLGRLGGYEIAGVVGRGGMGVVLKGFDPALNRYVAIKVLAPQLATSGAARQRFAREARAAASVVHENVVAIHAVADGGTLPFFVMPYIRGASLEKRLNQIGPLGVSEILRVSIQIAAGLAAAHAQGLVHRDIKPANILLEDGVERLQITDFGLARAADDASLTRTGVIAGTPQYMSPEQARGELVDSRSDLFSLGSVMYAMCTGRPPFRSETSYGTLRRICDDQPRPIREINPSIPEWLEAFVSRLHAKNSAERFETAQEISGLLAQCLAHLQQPTASPLPAAVLNLIPVEAPAPQPRRAAWLLSKLPLPARRAASFHGPSKQGFALASLVALALIGLGVWIGGHSPAARPPNQIVDQEEHEPAGAVPLSAAESSLESPLLSDEEMAREIRRLKAEIQTLESRISEMESASSAETEPPPLTKESEP